MIMPIPVEAFECCFCNSLYLDEDEAQECQERCAHVESPEAVDVFCCSRCGEVFRLESTAIDHEKTCKHPIEEEAPGKETCLTCRNGDVEGHRWPPCPNHHFAKVRPACDRYEYAPY
jgi:hypothetical protein